MNAPRNSARKADGAIVRHAPASVFAGLLLAAFVLMYLPSPLRAGQEHDSRAPLSQTERTGKRLFLQRCSLCHLGMPTKYQTYAPVLHNEIIADLGDDAVKEKIRDGSVAMPGFKYTLNEGDIDAIIAYLKRVKKEDVTHKPEKE
jgi:mono/diheme cytochrome c family protein